MTMKVKRLLGLIMMCVLLAVMTAGCSATEAGADTGVEGSAQTAESTETATADDSAADKQVTEEAAEDAAAEDEDAEEEYAEMKMMINDVPVKVSWENNASAKALAKMAEEGPVTIQTEPYGGFEQVGSIGETLPSNDTNIKTKAGDIMLYTSSQMVIFYGSNSWAYTRLGKITDKSASELKELLGGEGVTVMITAD